MSLSGRSDALLVAAMLIFAVRLLTALPSAVGVDTWLELAVGRLVWRTGIPHQDTLTTLALGRQWIDQQWLAQLGSYALYRAGGLGLLGTVNVASLVSGLGIAAAAARRLGGSVRDLLALALIAGWLFLPATEVRTQAFAVPLFAVTVYLLAVDSRAPSRRVYWVLPLLVLWANVHGSALLGAGLVVLYGATLAWQRRRELRSSWASAFRPAVLSLAPPLSLLCTPYGLHGLAYYTSALGNSALRHTVSEWRPITTSVLLAVPFFFIIGGIAWSFVRCPRRTTPWERLALLVLIAAAAGAVRNVTFFAVIVLALLPAWRSRPGEVSPQQSRSLRRRLNAGLLGMTMLLTSVTLLATLVRPAAQLEGSYDEPTMLAAIHTATRAQPDLRVIADTRYGDWILWQLPGLAGRVAADARYELYTPAEIGSLESLLSASGSGWKRAARGYRLFVLDRSADRAAVAGLLREPGARVLYAGRHAVVVLRSRGLH